MQCPHRTQSQGLSVARRLPLCSQLHARGFLVAGTHWQAEKYSQTVRPRPPPRLAPPRLAIQFDRGTA
jgi:hypothetical protein